MTAADADRVREEETEVQYEVWGAGPQGDFCAGADTLSDAQHYAAIYGQDGPVVIKVATTSRVVWPEASPALKSTAAKEGGRVMTCSYCDSPLYGDKCQTCGGKNPHMIREQDVGPGLDNGPLADILGTIRDNEPLTALQLAAINEAEERIRELGDDNG